MMMDIYELGSTAGATVAFLFFLFLSLGISLILYVLLVRHASRRAPFQGGMTLPPLLSALLSTAVFGLLFWAMYASTLRGFYRAELLEGEVRLHYLFPARIVTLPRLELGGAERVPAYKGRWYLRVHTGQGTTYESAPASERAVRESWEGFNGYLGLASAP